MAFPTRFLPAAAWAGAALLDPLAAVAQDVGARDADARARATLEEMRPEEKVILTHGIMPIPFLGRPVEIPDDAIPGAGYIAGIPRLGVPALRETDASLGVSWVGGLRGDGATALPSGLAMGSTWNPELIRRGGATIGSEAHAKGFNVMLAGGANLMRDPRNGRTFEYLSEDPLLTGVLVGNAIAGIQSNHILSTIKHFALNGQETGRQFADVRISDGAARESDLLAFQIGIEIGQPGAVMCAYNRVLGHQTCDSEYLLTEVLKRDWGYRGFVLSDWGGVDSVTAALAGLDQQSGAQLDPELLFGDRLLAAAEEDPRYAERLDDMNFRILRAIYAHGLDRHPARPGGEIDFEANAGVALEIARQGIVLLRNEADALPLSRGTQSIVVLGGYADSGVLSGAGSSQVHAEGGPAVQVPVANVGPLSMLFSEQYHRSIPLAAIRAMAPDAKVTFRNGWSVSEAATQAARADVAIVFATKWSSEGRDQADLRLGRGQDELIAAVAEANPYTIVVLETGNPVTMPWLDSTAAVVQAWYPGVRGGEAIASVLFGETNPSGHLPISFARSEDDLPRPRIDGFAELEPDFTGALPTPDAELHVDYDIEGSDLGYRWNAREGKTALFPFGFGLSYTTFSHGDLATDGRTASFTVRNTGERAGADVAQVYLLARNGETVQRLVGFQRVELGPGESRTVEVAIDPRLLAEYEDDAWSLAAGTYTLGLATDAETVVQRRDVTLPAHRWTDREPAPWP